MDMCGYIRPHMCMGGLAEASRLAEGKVVEHLDGRLCVSRERKRREYVEKSIIEV